MWMLRRKYEKIEAQMEASQRTWKRARIEEEAIEEETKSDTESEDEKTPMEKWWEEGAKLADQYKFEREKKLEDFAKRYRDAIQIEEDALNEPDQETSWLLQILCLGNKEAILEGKEVWKQDYAKRKRSTRKRIEETTIEEQENHE